MRVAGSPKISEKIYLADISAEFAESEAENSPEVIEEQEKRAWVQFRRGTALDDQRRYDFGKAQTVRYTIPGSEAQFVMEDVRENPLRRAMFEVWTTMTDADNFMNERGEPVFPQMPLSNVPFPIFESIWISLDMLVAAAIHAACISINQEWNDGIT